MILSVLRRPRLPRQVQSRKTLTVTWLLRVAVTPVTDGFDNKRRQCKRSIDTIESIPLILDFYGFYKSLSNITPHCVTASFQSSFSPPKVYRFPAPFSYAVVASMTVFTFIDGQEEIFIVMTQLSWISYWLQWGSIPRQMAAKIRGSNIKWIGKVKEHI